MEIDPTRTRLAPRVAVALLLGACALVSAQPPPPGVPAPADPGEEGSPYAEVAPLPVAFQTLTALALRPDGALLACDGGSGEIKLIRADGTPAGSLQPGFRPEAIAIAPDGGFYCGGAGALARFDAAGRKTASGAMPPDAASEAAPRRRAWSKPSQVSGIAVSKGDVFVAFGSGWSVGSKSKLYRYDGDLRAPKLLADGLRGCCQRCDIVARDGVLYLAENAAHRVVLYDREGAILGKWGEFSRTDPAGFGSCCNPMNLAFGDDDSLYTAESGLGRIKRYKTDGGFLGLMGYVGVERFSQAGHMAASCSNIAIAVGPRAGRIYVMDIKTNQIRVLQRKGGIGTAD